LPGLRSPLSFAGSWSASWNVVPPLYDGVNVNFCGSPDGFVTLSTRMWPALTFVYVQVT